MTMSQTNFLQNVFPTHLVNRMPESHIKLLAQFLIVSKWDADDILLYGLCVGSIKHLTERVGSYEL